MYVEVCENLGRTTICTYRRSRRAKAIVGKRSIHTTIEEPLALAAQRDPCVCPRIRALRLETQGRRGGCCRWTAAQCEGGVKPAAKSVPREQANPPVENTQRSHGLSEQSEVNAIDLLRPRNIKAHQRGRSDVVQAEPKRLDHCGIPLAEISSVQSMESLSTTTATTAGLPPRFPNPEICVSLSRQSLPDSHLTSSLVTYPRLGRRLFPHSARGAL